MFLQVPLKSEIQFILANNSKTDNPCDLNLSQQAYDIRKISKFTLVYHNALI